MQNVAESTRCAGGKQIDVYSSGETEISKPESLPRERAYTYTREYAREVSKLS